MPSDVTEDALPGGMPGAAGEAGTPPDEEIPLPEELLEAANVALGPEVVICECFARGGLQHEPDIVPTDEKVAMLTRIAECGFRRIETTAFADRGRWPQFADAEAVLAAMPPREGVQFRALCPDPPAVRRALAALERGRGPEEIGLVVAASDGHSQRSFGCTRAARWEQVGEMARLAGDGFVLVGAITVAFDCPIDGPIAPERVLEEAERFVALGIDRITIADTTGSATPPRVRDLVGWLHGAMPTATLIAHFRDGRGAGIANCVAAYEAGIRHFDTALGGTGDDPAQIAHGGGPSGNTSTEDLAMLFHAMGVATGLDLERLRATGRAAEALLGRRLHSRAVRLGDDEGG
ncbi:hydroxymethylglutaryl-CoA lyase [Roseomonas sp. NAR14]|uniref:Hydroxymethylglutaryl-CoA lyase n=1 Tax=Roseomonas acroporae TaxID=2937791 RepID=A0A9X2BU10_9PROT|nr:hydroxymethylglutaryl-CoA lyase [Roseomonas acroporae]MCK8784917.1 hydroxymethylglutaryl-CoA lyase [Roseomonas acroporae]